LCWWFWRDGHCHSGCLATLATTIFLGWLFLVSGVMGLISTFWMRRRRVSGGLDFGRARIVVGVLLLASPLRGAVTLTIVLVAFFVIEGVASIMFALDHKRQLSAAGAGCCERDHRSRLGAMIFAGLPSTAAWAIGLLSAINMGSADRRWPPWRCTRAIARPKLTATFPPRRLPPRPAWRASRRA